MTKQETIAHAVRGSNGERHVCLGFVEAINKARYLAEQSPNVQYSVVELIERPADEPTVVLDVTPAMLRDPTLLATSVSFHFGCGGGPLELRLSENRGG